MISQRRRAKLVTHHRVLDWDKSGYVTKQDFEQLAANFAKIRGQAPGSAMHKQLLENFQLIWTTYWQPAAKDKEKVSVEEFVTAIERAVDAGVRKDDALLPLLFEMIDGDKNGKITIEEHKQFFEAFRIDTPIAPTCSARWTPTRMASSRARSSSRPARSSSSSTSPTRRATCSGARSRASGATASAAASPSRSPRSASSRARGARS